MLTASFISLTLSGFAIGVSIVAIWISKRQNRLQREHSYLPDLIIESSAFFTYGDEEDAFPDTFSYSRVDKPKDTTGMSFHDLKVYNVGLGAAKEIEIIFSFDINWAVNFVNEFSPKHEFGGQVFKITMETNKMSIEHLHGVFFLSNIHEVFEQSFIPQYSVKSTYTSVPLPMYITMIYGIYSYLRWYHLSPQKEFPNFPEIKVNISFHNLQRKVYRKKYAVNIVWMGGRKEETWNHLNVRQIE